MRAILEEVSADSAVTLIYRAGHVDDLVFKHELDVLEDRRGVRIHYLTGSRRDHTGPRDPDGPLGAAVIRRLVPDVASLEVYLCGPGGMMTAAARTVRSLGVPVDRIHRERFDD